MSDKQRKLEDEKYLLVREKQIVKTSVIGIVVNVLLSSGKAIIGLLSNSIAIILDALNNLSDAMSSVIAIVGTKLAQKPADKKHPYGHGRAEYISAMIISAIVLYAGITSLIESFKKILKPETPDYSSLAIILVAVAVFAKIILGLYVQKVGKKTKSDSLVASGKDALFDSIISFSTLVAALVFKFTGFSLESYLGVIISAIIIKSGVEMIRDTISQILGERIDSDLAKKIKSTIVSVDDEIGGAYDLTLNNYGPERLMGSVHIEVPETWNSDKIDTVTRKIQIRVQEECGVILAAVGIYSVNKTCNQVSEIRTKVEEIAKTHPEIMQLHGFYVDVKNKMMSFDAVMSFDYPDMRKVFKIFQGEVKELCPDYSIFIQMDTDISD